MRTGTDCAKGCFNHSGEHTEADALLTEFEEELVQIVSELDDAEAAAKPRPFSCCDHNRILNLSLIFL